MLLKNKSIFIVEDNPSNRAIMQVLLEQHGAKVKIERWGFETLRFLKSVAPVDIILLDLMLTDEVSGFDIFDKIRSESEFDDVPIVAVSAMDASVAIPQVRSKGFAGFISKPVDFNKFPQQIAAAIAGEAVWHIR